MRGCQGYLGGGGVVVVVVVYFNFKNCLLCCICDFGE